jgi:hypothetical protein
VFENRVLRGIFGPMREEVTEEWRKLHNGELQNMYSPTNIIRQIKLRRMRWAGHVACMGEERKVYKLLVGKSGGKRPIGRLRHSSENGIKMDLRDIGWESVEWILQAQNRDQWLALVNTVMNFQVLPSWNYS